MKTFRVFRKDGSNFDVSAARIDIDSKTGVLVFVAADFVFSSGALALGEVVAVVEISSLANSSENS